MRMSVNKWDMLLCGVDIGATSIHADSYGGSSVAECAINTKVLLPQKPQSSVDSQEEGAGASELNLILSVIGAFGEFCPGLKPSHRGQKQNA